MAAAKQQKKPVVPRRGFPLDNSSWKELQMAKLAYELESGEDITTPQFVRTVIEAFVQRDQAAIVTLHEQVQAGRVGLGR